MSLLGLLPEEAHLGFILLLLLTPQPECPAMDLPTLLCCAQNRLTSHQHFS